MTTHEDRENILSGLRALQAYCLKLERESKHLQQAVWKGKYVTIIWGLKFDNEVLVFEPYVWVFPSESTEEKEAGIEDESERVELAKRLMERLLHLKEHELWPPILPGEWFSEA